MSESTGRSLGQIPGAKTIIMYRNGDAFYPGRKFVVNQRQTSTFDSFLSLVTRGIQAPLGAVRKIYTPREGHRVLDLGELIHGEGYVAAGTERLKKIDYCHITTKRPQRKKNKQIRPVVHSKIIVPARWRETINEPCSINVFSNGDILVPPARILLPKYTLTSWEGVLATVTEKVHLRAGTVRRLCRLDGTPLCGAAELKNNQYYVAVGAEKFRYLPYFHWVPNKGVILDFNDAIHNGILPPLKKDKHPRDVLTHPPEDTGDSHFYARPEGGKQPRRASKVPHRFTGQKDSVFRVTEKRKEMVGASEVQEDGSVKVELPIDQMEAKVVEEEQNEYKYSQLETGGQSPNRDFHRGYDVNWTTAYKTVNGSAAEELATNPPMPRGTSAKAGLEPEYKTKANSNSLQSKKERR
ncbi:doublecortin domain-containing protein 2C isoform X2 [Electrophorus electricus]|uniref:doublecortin domain-containing protein 2C isoform X2 n=1 Tax=Electrophorus electricus TaxID=8005 RepID=UPI0015D0CD58|nr:doublecortin domain-containing protein 2C isoform X2 [Electrophorus electricus]